MFKIDRRLSCIGLTLLMPLVVGAEPLGRFLPPGLSFSQIRAESPQPAGQPILITLVFTNATEKPIGLAEPENYVRLDGVGVRITDAQGKVREAALENSSHAGGSALLRLLAPGQSEGAPAIVPPLPEGKYTFQIGDKQVDLTVKDDPQLARKRSEELLGKLRRGDGVFPRFLFHKYPDPAVTEALVKDLMSEDSKTVAIAADCLLQLRKLPKDAGPVVRQAMKKQLEIIGRQQYRNAWAVGSLGRMAGKIGTDECLAAVLDLARSDLGSETRADAVYVLGTFDQARAVQELHAFLKDPDERVRFYAARTLAKRQDAAALPVLIEVARNGEDPWPRYAYEELARYPNNPQAEAVLKEGGRVVGRASFADWGGFAEPGRLLQAPGVQEELKLTDEQVRKINEIVEQTMSDYRDGFSRLGVGAPSGERQALQEELYEKMRKALARILTPGQEKRLWQINLQAKRTGALLMPEVRQKIVLSAEQERKIRAIMEDGRREMNDLGDGPQGYPEETQKKLNAVGEQTRQNIMSVLTEAQKKTFREMTGKPFDFQAHRPKGSRRAG
jgi:hypothetical protein